MGFLNALEQLLGGAAHNVASNVGHTAQAVGDAVNLGIPAAAHALGAQGGPQMLIDPKYLGHPADNTVRSGPMYEPIIDPINPHLQQLFQAAQRLQPMQPQQRMPQLNQQGQPMWNPSMGGAPLQTYMNSPSHAPIPSFMGNRYAQTNAGPEFTGQNAVDPMIFGYPPDNTAIPPRGF